MVRDLHSPAQLLNKIIFQDKLVFSAYTDTTGFELYFWDGTSAPTLVVDLNVGIPNGFPVTLEAHACLILRERPPGMC